MSILKEINRSGAKKTVTSADHGIKARKIKITKKLAEQIRTIPTAGWMHIIPSHGKWSVRKHGAVRASGIYSSKEKAINAAEKLSHSSPDSYIFIHDKNGDVVQTIHQ